MVARVEQFRPPNHDLSLSHFQSTAMSFSIDSPQLQALLAAVKWDSPDLNIRSMGSMGNIKLRPDVDDLKRDRMLSHSEGVSRLYVDQADEELEARKKRMSGVRRDRRSVSTNGYGYFSEHQAEPRENNVEYVPSFVIVAGANDLFRIEAEPNGIAKSTSAKTPSQWDPENRPRRNSISSLLRGNRYDLHFSLVHSY